MANAATRFTRKKTAGAAAVPARDFDPGNLPKNLILIGPGRTAASEELKNGTRICC